jgi:hypothetical protein
MYVLVLARHTCTVVCTRVAGGNTVFILNFLYLFINTHYVTSEEYTINTRFKYNVVTHIF